jgi:hypothetical protein
MSSWDPDFHSVDHYTTLQMGSQTARYDVGTHSSVNNQVTDIVAKLGEGARWSPQGLHKK